MISVDGGRGEILTRNPGDVGHDSSVDPGQLMQLLFGHFTQRAEVQRSLGEVFESARSVIVFAVGREIRYSCRAKVNYEISL